MITGFFQKHIQRRHNGVFDFGDVAGDARNNVAFAFFREKGQSQLQYLVKYLFANIFDHTISNINGLVSSQIVKANFQ